MITQTRKIKNFIRVAAFTLCVGAFIVPLPTKAGIEELAKVEKQKSSKKHSGSQGGGGTVYICNGPSATKYHRSSNCSGLNGCSASVSSTSKGNAEKKGYSPCAKCH